MRILITGLTAQQCGQGTRLGYEPVSDLYAKALRWAGHQVDHQKWTPGDDLSVYDAVIVGLVPFGSIAARYTYPAFDVIARARASGCALLFMVDDWNFPALVSGVAAMAEKPGRALMKATWTVHREWAVENAATVEAVMTALDSRPWPITILPAFPWGEHSVFDGLLPSRKLVCVDPTSFAEPYPIKYRQPTRRRRWWVMGTLSDQQKWVDSLKLTWPYEYVGGKASKAYYSLKEPQLVQSYADSWGVLCAPYKKIIGSGWWRNRYVYAARARAVLFANPADVRGLGKAYALDPVEVEQMSAGELLGLAEVQCEALRARSWNAIELVNALHDAIKEAKE